MYIFLNFRTFISLLNLQLIWYIDYVIKIKKMFKKSVDGNIYEYKYTSQIIEKLLYYKKIYMAIKSDVFVSNIRRRLILLTL